MAFTIYENPTPPPVENYNILKVGQDNEECLGNIAIEYDDLKKDGDEKNVHLYYTFNNGNKWSKYIKLLNNYDYDELKKEIDNIPEKAFNAAYPVGSPYVQFPGFDEPNRIFNHNMGFKCYWEEQNFNGAFFRAAYGNASPFNGGLQKEMVGPHTHYVGILNCTSFHSAGHGHSCRSWNGWSDGKESDKNTGTENRPANYTIRIWKRLS